MEVHRSKAGVAARVDAVKWLQVHLYVQCQAVVGAMSGYLDPESADFAKASEGVLARLRSCPAWRDQKGCPVERRCRVQSERDGPTTFKVAKVLMTASSSL